MRCSVALLASVFVAITPAGAVTEIDFNGQPFGSQVLSYVESGFLIEGFDGATIRFIEPQTYWGLPGDGTAFLFGSFTLQRADNALFDLKSIDLAQTSDGPAIYNEVYVYPNIQNDDGMYTVSVNLAPGRRFNTVTFDIEQASRILFWRTALTLPPGGSPNLAFDNLLLDNIGPPRSRSEVPEPASWAMMIAGGGALRRRTHIPRASLA